MFIEGTFSWDKEGERTSLEWPPLMSPNVAEAPSGGQLKDDLDLGRDPDLTAAELQARGSDGLIDAASPDDDLEPLAFGVTTANHDHVVRIYRDDTDLLDEADEDGDEGERPRRRRVSTGRGPLVLVGTAVMVALSGAYAAQAFGWRVPPKLRESAQPMKDFLWRLAPSRLVGFMATDDLPTRAVPRDLAHPRPPAVDSLAGSTPVSSVTEESVAPVPPAHIAGPGDRRVGVDPVAPDPEAVATSTALAAPEVGKIGRMEQAMEGEAAATGSTLAPPLGSGRAPDTSGTMGLGARARTAPPLPGNRDHLTRPWHGLVWSPAANALVPAVPAIEDRSAGVALRPAPDAVHVR